MEPTIATEMDMVFENIKPPHYIPITTSIWRWADKKESPKYYHIYTEFIKKNNYKTTLGDYKIILGGGSRGKSITEIFLSPTVTQIFLQYIEASIKIQQMFFSAWEKYLYSVIVKSGMEHSATESKMDETAPDIYPDEEHDAILEALEDERKSTASKNNLIKAKIAELTVTKKMGILDIKSVDALVSQLPHGKMFIYRVSQTNGSTNLLTVIRFSQYAVPPELTLVSTIKYPDNPTFITYLTTELDKIRMSDPENDNLYKIAAHNVEKWFIDLFLV